MSCSTAVRKNYKVFREIPDIQTAATGTDEMLTDKTTLSNILDTNGTPAKLIRFILSEQGTTLIKADLEVILFDTTVSMTAGKGDTFAYDGSVTSANVLGIIEIASTDYIEGVVEKNVTMVLNNIDNDALSIDYAIVVKNATAVTYGTNTLNMKFIREV